MTTILNRPASAGVAHDLLACGAALPANYPGRSAPRPSGDVTLSSRLIFDRAFPVEVRDHPTSAGVPPAIGRAA